MTRLRNILSSILKTILLGYTLLIGTVTHADVPRVVTDIAPVHSLVSQILKGVGTAQLIMQPGVSPHGYAMRPSEARALQNATHVVWIGASLTPWLSKAILNVAPNAMSLDLSANSNTHHLPTRDTALFETTHAHEDPHDHHDTSFDPHLWLDPDNALIWLAIIAESFAMSDPENAALYRKNARMAQATLTAQIAEITPRLAPFNHAKYVVFHDAYQYFETRFGLRPVGAILIAEGIAPSALRLNDIKQALKTEGVVCIFTEPQFNPKLLNALQTDRVRSVSLDPLGARLKVGVALYHDVLEAMTASFESCLR